MTQITWLACIVLRALCTVLQYKGNPIYLMVQASQTTAQGLWLAGVCGVIVGLAIWFGGPFAVKGISHGVLA